MEAACLWLRSARADLEDARLLAEAGRWYRVAFLAQQAVEKALKALHLLVLRREPPHTHHLPMLYRGLVEAGFRLPEELEDALYTLTKYYTVTRYPDAAGGPPEEAVGRREALDALRKAERIVGLVEDAAREAGVCAGEAAEGGATGG